MRDGATVAELGRARQVLSLAQRGCQLIPGEACDASQFRLATTYAISLDEPSELLPCSVYGGEPEPGPRGQSSSRGNPGGSTYTYTTRSQNMASTWRRDAWGRAR